MQKKLFYLTAVLLALSCILSGCDFRQEPAETTAASTAITVSTEKNGTAEQTKTILSTQLYVGKTGTIYVDPLDSRLHRADDSGDSTLFSNRVLGEFGVDGTRIWFSDVETGCVCAGDTETGEVVYHYRLPFTQFVIVGDMFYLLDTSVKGSEAILYKYDIAAGEWETRVLSGCIVTGNQQNIIMAKDRTYFVSYSDNVYSLNSVSYAGLDVTRLYAVPNTGRITDVYEYGTKLFFSDAIGSAYCYDTQTGETEVYLTGAVKIYGMSDEGLLFRKNPGYSTTLFLGNEDGQSADMRNGLVLAVNGSRSVLLRSSSGGYRISMMKYPEDAETFYLEKNPIAVLTGGNYVLVFTADSEYASLWNLKTGGTSRIHTARHEYTEVSVAEYIASTGIGVTPRAAVMETASADTVMSVVVAAIRKNDRYTLSTLYGDTAVFTPYSDWYVPELTFTKLSEDAASAVYNLAYTCYGDADQDALQYLPRSLRFCRIVLLRQENGWKIDAGAS